MLVGSHCFGYPSEQSTGNTYWFLLFFFQIKSQGSYILKWMKMEDFDLVGKKGKSKISDWQIWKWFQNNTIQKNTFFFVFAAIGGTACSYR